MSRKSQRNRPADTQAPDAGPTSVAQGRGRRAILVGAVAALAVAALAGVLLRGGDRSTPIQGSDPARAAALASEHSPSHGEAGAKVHVVEFLDPACETCALFYPIVRDLMAENPGRIRLSTRHVAFHEGSEFPVRVLEASRKQDKYWQTLEALFGSQGQWAPNHVVQQGLVLQAVSGVGLNMDQLMADMGSPEVTQRMARDMSDAAALKVTATPEYFVNGRPLPEFGDEQLVKLVREEVARAY
jgi:protein-disulfide isomerase